MKKQRELRSPSGHYVFVAPSRTRAFVLLLSVASLLALGYALLELSAVRNPVNIATAVTAAVLLVFCWTYLQARIPQRITVHRAIIEIRRDGHTHRYDLEDPGVDIRVRDGEIAFAHYMDDWVLVRARDVDWKVFTDVVMHYQNNADFNAEARDQRFSR